MDITDKVRKMIGRIEPYGDTNIDSDRYENLISTSVLVEDLIYDMIKVADYRGRPEHSMKKMGEKAYKDILYIKEMIEGSLE